MKSLRFPLGNHPARATVIARRSRSNPALLAQQPAAFARVFHSLKARGIFLLCAFFTILFLSYATAAPPVRVKVEFAPNLASPLGSQIRTIFPAQLQAELNARPIEGFPAGSRVTIRVENIQLSHDMVSGGFLDDNLPSLDTAEGVALVHDARGTLLKRIPLIAHSRSHYNLMDARNEPKRVVALMEIFAYWVPRQVHP